MPAAGSSAQEVVATAVQQAQDVPLALPNWSPLEDPAEGASQHPTAARPCSLGDLAQLNQVELLAHPVEWTGDHYATLGADGGPSKTGSM